MSKFRLVVKGTPEEARKEAEEYCIFAEDILEVEHEEKFNETFLTAEARFHAISLWYSKGADDAPFPAGTLLWFREIKEGSSKERFDQLGVKD